MKFSSTFVVLSQFALALVVSAATPNPLTGGHNVTCRDPSIFYNKDLKKYFVFGTGAGVRIWTSPSLTGPWTRTGSVLPKKCSTIDLPLKCEPWAPDINRLADGTYALYYSVSSLGKQESAIGLATSKSMQEGTWTDQGAIIRSHTGNASNAIDPNLYFHDKRPVLTYGSYWNGLYNLDLIDRKRIKGSMPGKHVAGGNGRPIEGGFMFRPKGSDWVYYFFSEGVTILGGATSHPAKGKEYKVRVGRAKTPDGPFLDKKGRKLTDNVPTDPTGYLVLGSHGDIYAPGGQSVFHDPVSEKSVMVYHYVDLKEKIGGPSYLGVNYLSFKSGWPELV
ncbi:glycoside hydrolase family 43 protein [Auriculariales sp. MPI-PUGE-AT-0066]|nr:glycoside hydrolase family 43 protein [Auriculariales sp. MPI-PUGE-AT-0066]